MKEELEIWKPLFISGVYYGDNYEVSNLGRIKSLRHNKILSPTASKTSKYSTGYRQASICVNNKRKQFYVHSVVAEAFLGKKQKNLVVDHINGDSLDNRICNLQYLSVRGNTSKRSNISKYGTGIYFTYERYQALIWVSLDRKKMFLGSYPKLEQAQKAYKIALSMGGENTTSILIEINYYRESLNLEKIIPKNRK